MKQFIIVALVAMTMIFAVPAPAEANKVSDAASAVYNGGKDVVTTTVHVLGSVIEPVVHFITKTTIKVVMVAVQHPVVTGVGVVMVAATVLAPPLLSVDCEVLATATTVETTEVVGTEVVETGVVDSVITGNTEIITGTKQWLYKLYNKEGNLLYVGISNDPERRFMEHEATKVWWNQVSSRTLEGYSTRQEVLNAEEDAIKNLHPCYNLVHNLLPICAT
jgi:predicted GIY-YIG superfamily endonuclease